MGVERNFNSESTNYAFVRLPACVDYQGHKFEISYPPTTHEWHQAARAVCSRCGHIRKDRP